VKPRRGEAAADPKSSVVAVMMQEPSSTPAQSLGSGWRVLAGHWTASAQGIYVEEGGGASWGHDETRARCGVEAEERRMEPGTTGAVEGGGGAISGRLSRARKFCGGDAVIVGRRRGRRQVSAGVKGASGAWCRLGAHTRILICSREDYW
jgi:hypothetical protein